MADSQPPSENDSRKVVNGKHEVNDRIMKEMLKPLVFGNHQRKFKFFTFAVSAAVTWYLVFQHDFGEHRHCFSWIRDYVDRRKQQFYTIDPTDEDFIKMKQKHENKQQEENNTTVQ